MIDITFNFQIGRRVSRADSASSLCAAAQPAGGAVPPHSSALPAGTLILITGGPHAGKHGTVVNTTLGWAGVRLPLIQCAGSARSLLALVRDEHCQRLEQTITPPSPKAHPEAQPKAAS